MFDNVLTRPCRPHYRIEELAKKKGVSMARISMAWIMAKPGVTAPILGTTSMANLEDILGAYFFRMPTRCVYLH